MDCRRWKSAGWSGEQVSLVKFQVNLFTNKQLITQKIKRKNINRKSEMNI